MRPKLRNGPAAARVERRAASRSRRPGGEVAEVFLAGEPEGSRLDGFYCGQYSGDLFVQPANRAEHQEFVG